MSAHTPGPWVANGSAIEDRPKRGPTTVIAYGVEAAADAHVIAAAPDLLVALKGVLHAHVPRNCHCPACVLGRAAIAKAEGQS